ncbi:LPS export ABC transporter permease LptF [Wenzhouxiangella sp. AB-CW3]|uniref:LPS export ABC transporter permease LptF n=1 Tax=Wenzhouxiangella sp. AB-CW3 TaxID=2771012 RepID=UPI00168A9E9B|nr:LPS export ABC transporter permease LptF [Wenzhouxiangella sp. AB-CW3]QOC23035.1 LPS export ABC transporter permease LptF [Wenzhouxiangella sp. AB-CW3]
MLILQRYILRQGLAASVLSLMVFLGVTVALFLAELVGDAAQGELPGSSVALLLALRLPEAIILVGPLALLTGLLLTFGRLQEESETIVVRASGLAFRRMLWPVLVLAGFWGGGLLLISGWLSPMALERTGQLMEDAAQHAMVAGVRPGQFGRMDGGRTTIYVGAIEGEGERLRDVFIQHMEGDLAEVLTAREGRVWTSPEDGTRYLTLTDGRQLQHGLPPNQGGLREVQFARNDLRLPTPEITSSESESGMTLNELRRPENPDERREWHWRLAAPAAAVLLGMLALPLSSRLPRQGRFGSIVIALVLYLLYSNAIHAGLIMMEQRAAMTGPGLWPVHGALAMLMAWMCVRQWRVW